MLQPLWIKSPRLSESNLSDVYRFMFNCSQPKFSAIILVLWSFYAIFRWTKFSSDPFDFSSSKSTGSARKALSCRATLIEPYALLVSKYVVNQNCVVEKVSNCDPSVIPTPSPTWRFVARLVRLSYNSIPSSLYPPPPPPLHLFRSHPPNGSIPKPQLATTKANRSPVVWAIRLIVFN